MLPPRVISSLLMRLKTYQITAINANKSKLEVSGQATVMKAAADFLPEQFKVHSPKLPLACFKLAGSERNTAQFSTTSPACCSVSGGGERGRHRAAPLQLPSGV